MRRSRKRTPSLPPNAFAADFLKLFEERDEPPTGPEADVAGPWRVEPIPALGYGLFRAGESLTRGFRPTAVFPERWLALLAASASPAPAATPSCAWNKKPARTVFPFRSTTAPRPGISSCSTRLWWRP